jgi:hypothetical protein
MMSPELEMTFYQPRDGEAEYSLATKGTDDVAQDRNTEVVFMTDDHASGKKYVAT